MLQKISIGGLTPFSIRLAKQRPAVSHVWWQQVIGGGSGTEKTVGESGEGTSRFSRECSDELVLGTFDSNPN